MATSNMTGQTLIRHIRPVDSGNGAKHRGRPTGDHLFDTVEGVEALVGGHLGPALEALFEALDLDGISRRHVRIQLGDVLLRRNGNGNGGGH